MSNSRVEMPTGRQARAEARAAAQRLREQGMKASLRDPLVHAAQQGGDVAILTRAARRFSRLKAMRSFAFRNIRNAIVAFAFSFIFMTWLMGLDATVALYVEAAARIFVEAPWYWVLAVSLLNGVLAWQAVMWLRNMTTAKGPTPH